MICLPLLFAALIVPIAKAEAPISYSYGPTCNAKFTPYLSEEKHIQLYEHELDGDPELKSLAKCESGFNPYATHENDGPDGTGSYGLFQFKIKTFVGYYNQYKLGPTMELKYVMAYIFDPEIQVKLTRLMLDDGLGYHWGCLNPRVE